MAIRLGGLRRRGRGGRRHSVAIAIALGVGVLLLSGVAASVPVPTAGASAVTGFRFCAIDFGHPACATTTTAGDEPSEVGVFFTATTALSSSDSVTIDGPSNSQFPGGSYQVSNTTLHTTCASSAVTLSDSGASVTVPVPAGCTATAGQGMDLVFVGMTMPSTAGYYAWGLHTTTDRTEQGSSVIKVTSVPGAPGSPTATPGDHKLTVSWAPSDFDGLLPLTGYQVYCAAGGPPSTSGTPTATVGRSTTAVTVLGLLNGIAYQCVVTAVNADGQSATSPIATATPGPTVPPPPRAVVATNGIRAITVSWARPAANGGAAVTSYDVYCSTTNPPSTSGAPSATVPATTTPLSATISHLPIGQQYFCVVTAINSVGASAASAVVTVFSATVPLAPTAPSATPTNVSEVLVSWTAPLHNGGEPVEGYDVYCSVTNPPSTASSPCTEVAPGATSVQVGGLVSSTTYYFEVAAVNAVGSSNPSKVVKATTP